MVHCEMELDATFPRALLYVGFQYCDDSFMDFIPLLRIIPLKSRQFF